MIQSPLHLPALLLLLPLVAGQPDPGKPPAEIVEKLLGGKVRALSQLADLVGPIPRDPSDWNQAIGPITRSRPSPPVAEVKVSFEIDIFHQDPEKVADPLLAGYEIELLWPRAACRKLLEARLGEPRVIQREGKRMLQLAKLYFLEDSGAADRCRLAWYSDAPEWSWPARTPMETRQLLVALNGLLRDGPSIDNLARHFKGLAPKADWTEFKVEGTGGWTAYVSSGASRSLKQVTFSFRPALPGRTLLATLGFRDPVVVAPDVHMQSRSVVDMARREELVDWPKVHGYEVSIHVDERNLRKTDEEWPGSPVWRSDELQVTGLSLWRRGE